MKVLTNQLNCFNKYVDKYTNAKESGKRFIIENRDQKDRHSDVVRVAGVYGRYVLFKSIDRGVSYTLNYADLFSSETTNLKVIEEGEKPDIGL